jgi:hypothetical protein
VWGAGGIGASFRAGAAGSGDDGLAAGAGGRAALGAGTAVGGDNGLFAAVDGAGSCEAASANSADKTSIEQTAAWSLRPIAGTNERVVLERGGASSAHVRARVAAAAVPSPPRRATFSCVV